MAIWDFENYLTEASTKQLNNRIVKFKEKTRENLTEKN